MEALNQIQNDPTIKQVLKDSCGGCLYDVSNYNKYDGPGKDHLLSLWAQLSESEKSCAGGLIKGAMSFLQGN